MKKIILAIPLVLMAAGCDTRSGNVLGGAAIGAAVNDDDRLEGAAVGAAAGLVVSAVQESNNTCHYTNTSTGQTWTAPCPS